MVRRVSAGNVRCESAHHQDPFCTCEADQPTRDPLPLATFNATSKQFHVSCCRALKHYKTVSSAFYDERGYIAQNMSHARYVYLLEDKPRTPILVFVGVDWSAKQFSPIHSRSETVCLPHASLQQIGGENGDKIKDLLANAKTTLLQTSADNCIEEFIATNQRLERLQVIDGIQQWIVYGDIDLKPMVNEQGEDTTPAWLAFPAADITNISQEAERHSASFILSFKQQAAPDRAFQLARLIQRYEHVRCAYVASKTKIRVQFNLPCTQALLSNVRTFCSAEGLANDEIRYEIPDVRERAPRIYHHHQRTESPERAALIDTKQRKVYLSHVDGLPITAEVANIVCSDLKLMPQRDSTLCTVRCMTTTKQEALGFHLVVYGGVILITAHHEALRGSSQEADGFPPA